MPVVDYKLFLSGVYFKQVIIRIFLNFMSGCIWLKNYPIPPHSRSCKEV